MGSHEKIKWQWETSQGEIMWWRFKEEQSFRTDSLSSFREGLHLSCSVIASNKWSVNLLDVKIAFLSRRNQHKESTKTTEMCIQTCRCN